MPEGTQLEGTLSGGTQPGGTQPGGTLPGGREPEASDVGRAIASVEMRSGLGLKDGEVQLGYGVDLGDAGPRIMAFYLHDFDVTKAYQSGGYSSITQYGEQRWDLDRRRTQELVRIGGKLRELPRIDEALCERKISWSKVVELAKVAVPEHEEAWLEIAQSHGCKDLRTEIQMASASGKPRDRADRKGLPQVFFDLHCRLPALLREKLDLAREKLSAERGVVLSDSELIDAMTDVLLGSDEDGSVPGRTRVSGSQFLIVLRPDEETGELLLDGSRGLQRLSAEERDLAASDAKVVVVRDRDGAPDGAPGGALGEAVITEDLSVAEKKIVDRATPPSLRARVLARDGFRCRCCGSRRAVHVHHIVYRKDGGLTWAFNLIVLCKACHALTHVGLLRLLGLHERDVVFANSKGNPLHDPGRRADRASLVELRRVFAARHAARDAAGCSLEEEARADGPTGIPSGSPAREPGCFVRLNDVPDKLDTSWWDRHEELIKMRNGNGLEFREGYAKALVDAARGATDDAGDASEVLKLADMKAGDPMSMGLIGREEVVKRLRAEAVGSRARGQAFPHMLLAGPPGTGKTSLAVAVAKGSGQALHRAMGTMIQDVPALLRLVTGLGEGDFLFLDEIHAMPRAVLETLYEVMEGGRLSLTLHCGNRSRCVSLALPKLTVLGATTEPDSLPSALMSRFGIVEYLPYYEVEELTRILRARALDEGVELPKAAARRLAQCSRGTPREALRLMARVFNQLFAMQIGCHAGDGKSAAGRLPLRGDVGLRNAGLPDAGLLKSVSLKHADKALAILGYDSEGFSELEQRYLTLLRSQKGPMALHRLAVELGCGEGTIRERIEPRFARMGLVAFTSKGRVAQRQERSQGQDRSKGQDRSQRQERSQGPRLSPRLSPVSDRNRGDLVSEADGISNAGWGWPERVPESGRTVMAVVEGWRGLALPG